MTAESQTRLWRSNTDYLTLSYAEAQLEYSQPGERLRDRLGLIHRIVPAAARYPVRLSLRLLFEEFFAAPSSSSPQTSAIDWLTANFRAGANLALFIHGATLAVGGAQLTRQLALLGYLDVLPPELSATLTAGSSPQYVEIVFHIYEDGVFGDFASLASYVPFDPPRS